MDAYNREGELAVLLHKKDNCVSDKQIQSTLELAKRDNVILTPHNAFNTKEAIEKKALHSIQQIKKFIEKATFTRPIPQNKNA